MLRSLLCVVFLALYCDAFRAPRVEPGPECWFQYVCGSEGSNLVSSMSNKDTAKECYDECAGNADCTHFSFREFWGGRTVCDLLSSCNNQEQCSNGASCTSGPNDCSKVNPCPMITYTEGNVIWSCDGLLDPYLNQVPDGYTCHTTCGGWKSQDGSDTSKASSTCENGVWSTVVLQPASDAVVNPPDMDTVCACEQFDIWYNPNDEPGADFYCTKTDFSDASPDLIKQIDPSEECVLMCDNYLVANVGCQNGAWLEADPDLGIACYSAPPTLPGNPTVTTPPATSTVV